ncbi:MAG: Sodium/glucose cotransporter [bacterium]|nr:Sodium/glucose cotransporter [bacterium]
MENQLVGLDYVVIGLYFGVLFWIAWWSTARSRTAVDSAVGYFLAGRNVGWFVIGASLFASNIGSEHLVGLAGTGAASGVAVAQFEILASLILLILAWVFVPFYMKTQVYTMPEFLERRYSPAARIYLSWISIMAYVLTKISVTIAAGGIVFESLMGIDFWTGALIVVSATGLYTVCGGLRAVVYTELMQMFIMIFGAVVVTVTGLVAVGGWGALQEIAGSSFFNMWQPVTDPNFPWTGILFGAPILGVWYWCTDQLIVQRVLSARDQCQARRGAIFGGYLKILPVFIFVMPGIAAYCLVQTGRLVLPKPDHALPALVAAFLPAGLRGLVVAGLLAALMSSLASVFNSCSTLITWDIYRKLNPHTSERQLVLVGRVATAILVILGLSWIPFIKSISGQLYQYLQSVQAYVSPPIAAVFLLGVFCKRLNSRGAMAALLTGLVLGLGRLVAEINKHALTGVLQRFAELNFLHFAVFLFIVCSAILVAVSLTAPAHSEAQLADVTYSTYRGPQENPARRRLDVQLSIVLALAVATVWLYFSG